MGKRINYRKAAMQESKKTIMDAAGVAFPKLGDAVGITGAVRHGANAVEYGVKAAREGTQKRITRAKKTIRKRVSPFSRALRRLR
jgi:hypothetical protein